MPNNMKGYTLIELVVVIVLLGLVVSFAAPRFRDAVLTDNLKTATRRLVNKILEMRNSAVEGHADYKLMFDLDKNAYWHELAEMTEEERAMAKEKRQSLPENIRITDIWINKKGKEMAGDVSLKFRKEGYAPKSAIHLESEDGREFTIVINPFLPQVKVLENYIEIENS